MAHSKKPTHIVKTGKTKIPKEDPKTNSFYGLIPSFSFCKYDSGAPWATSSDGKPSVDSLFHNLRGVEGMTWGGIIQASGGRTHGTNSHYMPIHKLTKEAQSRAERMGLIGQELFSLRTQNTVRIWGVIEPKTGCFFVIWYDPEHKVYPVGK